MFAPIGVRPWKITVIVAIVGGMAFWLGDSIGSDADPPLTVPNETAASLRLALAAPPAPSPVARQHPTGEWIGQDGKDYVGPSSKQGPSGVQDVHIILRGLPPDREVETIRILGHGGDEWIYNGRPGGPYAAVLIREPRATIADLYIEPTRVETGRSFQITVALDDGRKAEFHMKGGTADPNLRMPEATLEAHWIGQDGQDRTGPGPSVGPDGIQDIRVRLERLAPDVEIEAVTIGRPGGEGWAFGLNPEGKANAELIRDPDDPSRGALFFNPIAGLAGQDLTIEVRYANGTTDTTTLNAGTADPQLRMPAPELPRVVSTNIQARWVGQDGVNPNGPGDVQIALEGLPTNREVIAAGLNNSARGFWVARANDSVSFTSDRAALPLVYRRSGSGKASLFFTPNRDETGSQMVLRLLFRDGSMAVVRFEGGACDPDRRVPAIARTTTKARPGDDLQALVDRGGIVRLATGAYRLNRPLVLNQPVALIGAPGATLLFEQPAEAPPWTSAIKIHHGPTTLEGFNIRFNGPVRWDQGVNFGPALIGTSDNKDPDQGGLKVNLTFRKLDLETPPPSTDWELAPRLLRLVSAESGTIEDNTLRGGTIELRDGPWRIVNNTHNGTVPNTFAYSVISGYDTYDLFIEGNTVRPEAPSGKLWRWLVLTRSGHGGIIRDNTIEGVGPRDDDEHPHPNAPEVVLTEAYRLHFEGKPAAISEDRQLLAIPEPQGEAARTGSVVALLSGPNAGTFVRVAQAIDETTYLLHEPLPEAVGDLSITTGFLDQVIEGNSIDARGSTVAMPLVLSGNHFGTKVVGNRFFGGSLAFRLEACASELPVHWGWSRAPFFGVEIVGNEIEDATRGGAVYIEHTRATKSSRGRVYLTASLKGNTARWSAPFLKQHGTEDLVAFRIGQGPTLDPGDLVVTMQGTQIQPPAGTQVGPTLRIEAGTVNGTEYVDRRFELSVAR